MSRPYHEALARLAGRDRPVPLTRILNRFWIGRSSMAIGEDELMTELAIALDLLADPLVRPLRFVPDSALEETVSSEPVSVVQFPAQQRKCREFFSFRPCEAGKGAKSSNWLRGLQAISLRVRAGKFLHVAGN